MQDKIQVLLKLKQITEKYSNIVTKNKGEIVQTQNWGLLNLAYMIKKNKKGNYIHFKIKGPTSINSDLEKNERLDKNLLRYMTVKVKKFDLDTNYFSKKIKMKKKLMLKKKMKINAKKKK